MAANEALVMNANQLAPQVWNEGRVRDALINAITLGKARNKNPNAATITIPAFMKNHLNSDPIAIQIFRELKPDWWKAGVRFGAGRGDATLKDYTFPYDIDERYEPERHSFLHSSVTFFSLTNQYFHFLIRHSYQQFQTLFFPLSHIMIMFL
jgi:hypothetical protein